MPQPDLAVVDVETTGFVPEKHDRVVEIAIVRTDFQGREQVRFETLVNPGRDVGPTHVHGITAEMVKDASPFGALADAIPELLEPRTLRTRPEVRMAVFNFIEGFYNQRRRHSALDYESPVSYERKHRSVA